MKSSFALATFVAALLLLAPPAQAQPSLRLRITLQPDCYRPSLEAMCDKRKTGPRDNVRLDLGPQIAIWLERPDGTFVETVLVTNLTALLGIGNRPGHVNLPSGPKFPYGKRPMVLPVWAHKRNVRYDTLVMQDGLETEYWLGFHERYSSPDPYFCRPVTYDEVDVDAISCPTQRFNSVKGRPYDEARDLKPPHIENGVPKPYVPTAKSYYPPRNDLINFTDSDCSFGAMAGCPIAAKDFARINDLDSVASATPPYGRPFSKLWTVPEVIADGDYVLWVEINKEFDNNASHAYKAHDDNMLLEWGLKNNVGQPSVLFKLPFKLDRKQGVVASTAELAGYGDPDGATGRLHAPDSTISDAPGSGVGRLLSISAPPTPGAAAVTGKIIIATEPGGSVEPPPPPDAGVDAPVDAGAGDDAGSPAETAPPLCALDQAAPLEVVIDTVAAEEATVSFMEPAGAVWAGVDEYEIRRWNGTERSELAFTSGMPLLPIARLEPGAKVTVRVPNLKSQTQYTVGARARGSCGKGRVAYGNFTTPIREFTMLSGCFVATAAYGSPLAKDVALLRRLRDAAARRTGLGAAAADVYARSSPPVANLIRESDAARAVVRQMLAPIVGVARSLAR